MFRVYNKSDYTRCSDPIACAMTQVQLKTHCIKLVRCQEIRTTTSTSTTTRKPIEPESTSTISVIIGIVIVLVLFGFSFVVVKKKCSKTVTIPEQMILMSELNVN